MSTTYDSTKDTMDHINIIKRVFNDIIIPEVINRCETHDVSKLSSPEKEVYDKYIPELKKYEFGSPEYREVREAMKKEGLDHHFEVNRHHPEHFENGITDMTIIDLLEYVVDHFSSSLKSTSSFEVGEAKNKELYNINDDLFKIIMNTYNEYFKPIELDIKIEELLK